MANVFGIVHDESSPLQFFKIGIFNQKRASKIVNSQLDMRRPTPNCGLILLRQKFFPSIILADMFRQDASLTIADIKN